MDDPFGNAAAAGAAGGHARTHSDDAKPWGPNATYFRNSGGAGGDVPPQQYRPERDTAAEHGTQSSFTIGEDLPADVADSFAQRASSPRPRASSIPSLARVPVPSYAASDEHLAR